MNTLIMMVGLPRSGKSTQAREIGCPIVNPDSIRLTLTGQAFYKDAEPFVWATTRTMITSLFLAGHETVVLDATNTTKERRDNFIDKRWKRVFFIVDTDENVCKRRAVCGDRGDLIPIIENMAKTFILPTKDELKEWEL